MRYCLTFPQQRPRPVLVQRERQLLLARVRPQFLPRGRRRRRPGHGGHRRGRGLSAEADKLLSVFMCFPYSKKIILLEMQLRLHKWYLVLCHTERLLTPSELRTSYFWAAWDFRGALKNLER